MGDVEETNKLKFRFQGRNIVVEYEAETKDIDFQELEIHASTFIENEIKKLKEVDKE